MKKQTTCTRSVLVFLFIILPCMAFSQLNNWTNYANKDNIYDLLSDGDYLWIATDGGLVRLNKQTGEKAFFDRANAALPDNHLRALAKDKEGNIWMTSQNNGVGKFDGTTCREVYKKDNSGISSDQWCTAIMIDKEDNKWIGSLLWLNKFDGKNWQSWTNPGSIDIAIYWSLHAIAFDNDDTLWLGAKATGFYFGKFTGQEIEVYPEVNAPVRSIVVDKNNVKWLASEEGLIKFDGTTFTKYNRDNSEVPSNIVLDAKLDAEGNMWFSSNNYLVKYDGTNFVKYENTLSKEPIYAIELDADNTIWAGTNVDGLYKFKNGKFEKIDICNSPLTTNNLNFGVVVDASNNVWFGTANELVKIDKEDKWHNLFRKEKLFNPQRRVNALAADPNGNLWVSLGISDTCVIKIDTNGDTIAFTDKNSILVSGNFGMITDFAFDKKGNVWAASINGLCHYDGTKWERFTPENSPLVAYTCTSVEADKDGNIWGGTAQGSDLQDGKGVGCLFKYDGKQWTIYTTENSGLPVNFVVDTKFDSKNNLWISTYEQGGSIYFETGGGLTKFDGANWTTYNRKNSGLQSNTIMNITIDKNDCLWLTAPGKIGLIRFDGTDCSVFNQENSGIAFNEVGSIAFDYERDLVWMTHLRNSGLSTARYNGGNSIENEHMEASKPFSIHHNRSSSEITFRFANEITNSQVKVFDASGKLIYSGKLSSANSKHVFPLQELKINHAGLYIINISSAEGQNYTEKFSVVK